MIDYFHNLGREIAANAREGWGEFKADFKANAIAAIPLTVVAITVSLAIADQSKVPLIAGLWTVVIAGLCNTICSILFGGSKITIAGPAAGLAPFVASSVTDLGHGDLMIGYRRFLVVVLCCGVLQMAFAAFKWARYIVFPVSVERGMFVAIGISLIVSSLGTFTGNKLSGHNLYEKASHLPYAVSHINPKVMEISLVCVILLFGMTIAFSKWKPIGYVAPLSATAAAWIMSYLLGLDASFRVNVPTNLSDGIVTPDFPGAYADLSTHGWSYFKILVGCKFIDSAELLGTCGGIDKIDPKRRRTQANPALLGAGITNIISACVGGITSIQEVMRSRMLILAGGQSMGANFFMAVITILAMVFAGEFMSVLPVAGLMAIVFQVAVKLIYNKENEVWSKTWKLGYSQVAVFLAVIVGTVFEDLLAGIIAGFALEIGILTYYALFHKGAKHSRELIGSFQTLKGLFWSPVASAGLENGVYHIHLNRSVTFWNCRHLQAAFQKIPHDEGTKVDVIIDREAACFMIDTTAMEEIVESFKHYYQHAGRGDVKLLALEDMGPVSEHIHAAHVCRGHRQVQVVPVPAVIAAANHITR